MTTFPPPPLSLPSSELSPYSAGIKAKAHLVLYRPCHSLSNEWISTPAIRRVFNALIRSSRHRTLVVENLHIPSMFLARFLCVRIPTIPPSFISPPCCVLFHLVVRRHDDVSWAKKYQNSMMTPDGLGCGGASYPMLCIEMRVRNVRQFTGGYPLRRQTKK